MNRLSIENPYLLNILSLFVGLMGFVFVQIDANMMNLFSIQFLILSLVLLGYFIRWADLLDKKASFNVSYINSIVGYPILIFSFGLSIILLNSSGSLTFDGRLAVYGNSMLFGINMSLSLFIFPLLPLLAKSFLLRKISLFFWFYTFILNLILAPSKSIFISFIFQILLYRFISNKINGDIKLHKLFSLKFIIFISLVSISTLIFMYVKIGDSFFGVIIHRIAYNFDIAIYSSMIDFEKSPEYSNLFYAVFPLLKQVFTSLNSIEFSKIPEWVLYEALNIDITNRYGFPNDNFIVGLMLSYRYLSTALFFVFLMLIDLYIRYILSKNRFSYITLYFLLILPQFFLSTQDFMIQFFVVSFSVIPLHLLYIILSKKGI